MSGKSSIPPYRRQGLYYPYFHVRDERWLKVAALYWPKIVRIVPDDYRTQDSYTVRALADDFIVRRSPGRSVEAIAPQFIDLVTRHASELRPRFRDWTQMQSPGPVGPIYRESVSTMSLEQQKEMMRLQYKDFERGPLAALHVSEMTSEVRDTLVDADLAIWRDPSTTMRIMPNSIDGTPVYNRRKPVYQELDDWILMHPDLVSVYTSVLAEDFAVSNFLQPTTDQEFAYAVANNWTADRIASTLLESQPQAGSLSTDELPETLGLLALELIVPADLDRIPVAHIIDIRNRYGAEFYAFGQAVDEAAASMAALADIRDPPMLEDYLQQVVTVRFAQPLEELRKQMRRLTGDAATTAINVKTQLPAAVTLAGGAWLAGQPLLAGIGGTAIGLVAIGRNVRQQRQHALQSAPAASFLLHTHERLQPQNLLARTIHRLTRIAGLISTE